MSLVRGVTFRSCDFMLPAVISSLVLCASYTDGARSKLTMPSLPVPDDTPISVALHAHPPFLVRT